MLPIRPRPARFARPVRARLPRSALPWWLAVLALAACTGAVVNGVLTRAAAAEARWGVTTTVLVVTAPIAPGEAVDDRHTELRRFPAALAPPGALHTRPAGRVAVAALAEGEAVVASRVSGERAAGVAALLPPGTRALVVPLQVAGLPVRVGDRVDLLASGGGGPASDLPAAGTTAAAPVGPPVARAALVVAVPPDALVVALDADDAARVAAALGQAPLVPALTAPGG